MVVDEEVEEDSLDVDLGVLIKKPSQMLAFRSLHIMSLSTGERWSRAVMLALGMSCVISGLYYVTQSYTDSRALLIAQYSSAIQAFSEYLPFFSALDVDISCDGLNYERLVKRQDQVTGLCRDSTCDVRSDIPSYLSVVHVLANISRDIVDCYLTVASSSTPPPLKSVLLLPDGKLQTKVDVHLNAKMCHNRGGTYDGVHGICWAQSWLKSGCLTISGTSVSNMSLGGVVASGSSCKLIDSAKSYAVWDYAEFHPPSFGPSLTLRSFKDPFMIAQFITDGTLDFGSTPKDNYSTGVVLLSLGCALFLPQICLCSFRLRSWLQERSRRRYHANLQRADEFDSPSDLPIGANSKSGSRTRLEMRSARPCSDGGTMAAVGTMVDMSSMARRPSPRPTKATIVDVSLATTNV